MIEVRQATVADVPGIARVCSEGVRVTDGSQNLAPPEAIEAGIELYYNHDRLTREVQDITDVQSGYFVAIDTVLDQVVGATCGGLTDTTTAILYCLYLDPTRKREGIGSKLLKIVTDDAVKRGANVQWVHATKGNEMGIPFYLAKGFEFSHWEPNTYLPGGGTDWVAKRNIGKETD